MVRQKSFTLGVTKEKNFENFAYTVALFVVAIVA